MFEKSVKVFALGLCIWICHVAAKPMKDIFLWSYEEPRSDVNLLLTCPEKFTLLGDKCYLFELNKKLDWFDAISYCEDLYANLIENPNEGEISKIYKHLIFSDGFTYSKETEGFWVFDQRTSDMCTKLSFDAGKYEISDDYLCDLKKYFICKSNARENEFESASNEITETSVQTTEDADETTAESSEEETFTTTTTTTTTTIPILSTSSCPKGFKKLGNKCYFIEDSQELNWYESDRKCKNMKAKMLTIENANEMRLVEDALIQMGLISEQRQDWGGFWTAGTDLGSEGAFHWQSTGHEMSYTKWFVTEPNNANSNEDCVELRYLGRQLFMNDRTCMRENYAVCETELQASNSENTTSALKSNSCEELELLKQNFEAQQIIVNMLYGEQQCERNE